MPFKCVAKEVESLENLVIGDSDTGVMTTVNNIVIPVQTKETTKTTPWFVSVSKSLGGGASVIFEHADSGTNQADSDETVIALRVDF